nr:reverse transcriptase domain-containing protein [Tanacetum cinerariifolium]
MSTEGNGDLLVPDLRTIKELCQPTLNGRGGPISPIAIQKTNFGLKNDMIQQVQNSCRFHGLPGDDANKHLDKFLHVTQSIKVNGVTDDALRLYLFSHSLTHHDIIWFYRFLRNSINTFEQIAKKILGKYFPPSMVTKLGNDITNFRQRPDESLFEAWEHYKLSIYLCSNHNMLPVTQIDTFYNELTLRHRDTINAAAGGTFMKRRPEECCDLIENMTTHHNDWDTSARRMIVQPSLAKPITYMLREPIKVEDLKGITTRSGTAYQGPTIPTTSSSSPKVMERETKVTKDTVPPTNNESTKDVQPSVVQIETPIPNFEPVFAPIAEPVVAPVSASKPNQKPSILYPSRFHDQKLHDKANNQKEKFFQDLNFNISFADALILMPKVEQAFPSELTPTLMTLELADRSISRPIGVAEDVFVKRSFLKTRKALIDVYEGELTLRVGKEAITFNLNQTSRYSANYNDMTADRIDVIDMACEEYLQEVLGFFDVISSVNPTPYYDPIVSTSSPTLIPFEDSDFLLEEVDAFLALEDDPTSPKVNHSYFDMERNIILLKAFLNDDPSLPPPT